jgi:V-type H+-transporting ATPase proteolipid subunit
MTLLFKFVIFSIDLGSAYGCAKSGVGICSMGVLKPELIMRSVIPVIMAGILGIYGFIVSILIGQKSKRYFEWIIGVVKPDSMTDYQGYAYLASGLCCGFSSLVRFSLISNFFPGVQRPRLVNIVLFV